MHLKPYNFQHTNAFCVQKLSGRIIYTVGCVYMPTDSISVRSGMHCLNEELGGHRGR